jgi:hypothetical protein
MHRDNLMEMLASFAPEAGDSGQNRGLKIHGVSVGNIQVSRNWGRRQPELSSTDLSG